MRIAASVTRALAAAQDIKMARAQFDQIRVICHRLSGRPDVRPSVVDVWRSTVPNVPEMLVASKTCGAIGCDAIEATWQLCSGCNSQVYCSRKCQKL